MSDPEVSKIERKLEEILAPLKVTNNPERKRMLLKQMRTLMADLDTVVFDHSMHRLFLITSRLKCAPALRIPPARFE
jgi:hypothetical protein